MNRALFVLSTVMVLWFEPCAMARQSGVVYSPHNLSATGPGTIKATSEDQVCVFCHAPHNATPVQPLWNRSLSVSSYLVYSSRSLDALPGQPTGSSKMCLSCHDGTIALGAVNSRVMPIDLAGGITRLPAGHANVGTDLRDDHPVSFRYDAGLAGRDTKLRSPSSLPDTLKLDAGGELQCTTCHDAHSNAFGKFLTMSNTASQMCTSCHSMGTTSVSGHNACNACHQPHAAPSGPYLLRGATVTATCNACHNGTVTGASNIHAQLQKISNHDTGSPVDPTGQPQASTTCTSCHDPHTMGTGRGSAPSIHPNFGRVKGVNTAGAAVAAAAYEYETCFKCHGDNAAVVPLISRRVVSNNTRLEFSPTAASFHPIAAPGRATNVPSLKTPYTPASFIYCSDCHQSDGARILGGGNPNGTHGSTNTGLLVERYDTADNTTESAAAYALCYRCHDRNSILGDRSFRYHKKHVQEKRSPCSACHDSHGISSTQGTTTSNAHLINFASTIVTPNSAGRLDYTSTGTFRGTCNLRCHGENHSNETY